MMLCVVLCVVCCVVCGVLDISQNFVWMPGSCCSSAGDQSLDPQKTSALGE
jgi:hypothetical protein